MIVSSVIGEKGSGLTCNSGTAWGICLVTIAASSHSIGELQYDVSRAVIDNLLKGAAGQAVQAMNLALEIAETTGLEHPGMSPC